MKTKLTDIAKEIDGYLKMFEADPKINVSKNGRPSKYFMAYASQYGRFVGVTYVSYQGHRSLSRTEAEKYLAWLRQGGVGTHYKAGID